MCDVFYIKGNKFPVKLEKKNMEFPDAEQTENHQKVG